MHRESHTLAPSRLTPSTCVSCARLQGSFDIVHVKDAVGHTFATRLTNVFVIGKGDKPLISLPKGKGVRCAPAAFLLH